MERNLLLLFCLRTIYSSPTATNRQRTMTEISLVFIQGILLFTFWYHHIFSTQIKIPNARWLGKNSNSSIVIIIRHSQHATEPSSFGGLPRRVASSLLCLPLPAKPKPKMLVPFQAFTFIRQTAVWLS